MIDEMCYIAKLTNTTVIGFSLRHENSGLVCSRASLTSWGEGASLVLVHHPSSDGVMIKILYRVDVLLHRPSLYPIFSYWVGSN